MSGILERLDDLWEKVSDFEFRCAGRKTNMVGSLGIYFFG